MSEEQAQYGSKVIKTESSGTNYDKLRHTEFVEEMIKLSKHYEGHELTLKDQLITTQRELIAYLFERIEPHKIGIEGTELRKKISELEQQLG